MGEGGEDGGVNWEEVQRQREHGVPFLQVGAEQRRLSTPSAFCAPLLNDLVWDASPTCVRLDSFLASGGFKTRCWMNFFSHNALIMLWWLFK